MSGVFRPELPPELSSNTRSTPGSLLDQVLAPDNLAAAWRAVQEGDKETGADGLARVEFGERAQAEIAALDSEVRSGRYAPGPRREIELPGRASRRVSLACARDRVLQSATWQVVGPLLERLCAKDGTGLQSPHYCNSPGEAIDQVSLGREQGLNLVIEADLCAGLDSIPRESLLDRFAAALPEPSLQPLIALWRPASAGAQGADGTVLAQGDPVVSLIAALCLARFDRLIGRQGRLLIRYAGQFVILCQDLETAEQALEDADALLRADGLELDFSTTRISSFANGFEFLGTCFKEGRQWRQTVPSPLPDSPPCPLAEPGERAGEREEDADGDEEIASASPPLLRTIHITEHGAYLHRRGGRIVVSRDDADLFEIPIEEIDQVCVAHEGKVSFGALREFLAHKIGFVVTSHAGEPVGWLDNLSGGNAILHGEQFRRAEDRDFCLAAARAMVGGKIANSRLIARRYARNHDGADGDADGDLAHLERTLARADSLEVVRGLEGAAARRYFEVLGNFLGSDWNFRQRNRRPPRDPVNVLLSYGYAILFQNVLTLLVRRGLHPYVGALHALADRHPGLASDLMEEFRPLVVDAVVLKLLLNGRLKPEHFEQGGDDCPCRLLPAGRRLFVKSLEDKLDAPLRHPQSGKSIDLRRAIAGQASLWAEHVGGRADSYRPFILH